MRLVLACALALIIPACTLERGTRPSTETAITPEEAARAVVDSLADAMSRMDANGALQWYAVDPGFTYVVDGTVLRGRNAFDDYIRNYWNGVKAVERIERENSYAYTLGENGAVITVAFREMRLDTADESSVVSGVWTKVVRRTPNGWRIVHGHLSLPASEERAAKP